MDIKASIPINYCVKSAHVHGANREKPDKNPLRLLPTDSLSKKLTLVDIQRVGRYAIRLIWADGHKTGIYTFEFLHALPSDPTETVPS